MDPEMDIDDSSDEDLIDDIDPDVITFNTGDSDSDLKLLTLSNNATAFLRDNDFKILNGNEETILEASDLIEGFLFALPLMQMKSTLKESYLRLLDVLFDVRFPQTRIVNHVLVVGLRYMKNSFEYFSSIMTPTNNDKLNYFLKNAHDAKNGFSIHGFRFSDFLIADFFREDCPGALLDILRYGCADLLKDKRLQLKHNNSRKVGDTMITEYKLLEIVQFFLSVWSYMRRIPNVEIQSKADCIKIIFRSLHTFSFEQLYELSNFADFSNGFQLFKSFGLRFLNNTKRFPELDERMGKEPTKLKHLCRFEIRRTLYKNWSLPDGIKTLGLPFVLEEYLDLKTD